MRIGVTPSDETRRKLRELVVYISNRCETDVHFGMIKLNKIILRADRLAYLRYGNTITGSEYMRLPKGFVPKHMKMILDELESSKEIVIKHRQYFDHVQKRVIPLREANLDELTSKDVALVEEIISECASLDASTLSYQSHGIAWRLVSDKQTVPNSAFLLADNQEFSEQEIEEGYALIEKHGWDVYVNQ